jgi:hypothetical protein
MTSANWWESSPLVTHPGNASRGVTGGGAAAANWWESAPIVGQAIQSPAAPVEAQKLFEAAPAVEGEPAHFVGPRGEWVLPEQLPAAAAERQTLINEKAAAANDQGLPGAGAVGSVVGGAMYGWAPKAVGMLESLRTGVPVAQVAMSERQRMELYKQQHPYANMAGNVLGGGASLAAAAPLLEAAPVVGPALGAAGNVLGRLRGLGTAGAIGASAAGNAALGGALGGLEAAGEDKSVGQGVLHGAIAGGIAGPAIEGAVRGVANTVGPWASEYMQRQIAAGAVPTIGETLAHTGPHGVGEGGPMWRSLIKQGEEVLAGAPVAGATARRAQQLSRETMNRDMINEVLAPIGESIAPDTAVGHNMVKEAGDKFGKAYDQLIPQIKGQVDAPLTHSIAQARDRVPEALKGDFDATIADIISSKADPHTLELSGSKFKDAESELRQEVTNYVSGGASTASERKLGRALGDVRDALFTMMDRHNAPDVAERLRDINHGYSMLIPIEKAASMVGAQGGVFNASQLYSALKAVNTTARKRGIARGTANMQEAIENAKEAAVRQINDSGSAGRLELPAAAAALMAGNWMLPAATMIGGNALYARPVQNVLRQLAAGAPAPRQAIASQLRGIAPQVGVIAGQQPDVQENIPYVNYLARR